MSDFLKDFVWATENSLDGTLNVKKASLRKISLEDLKGFVRISENLLINKAKKDLWKVEENDQGELMIYRLFDSTEESPLKV